MAETDWSQFKPADAPDQGASSVDWAQFKPAPGRKGGFGAAVIEGAQSTGRSLKAAGQAVVGDLTGVEKTAQDQNLAQENSQAAALFAFKQSLAGRKKEDDDSIMAGVKNYLGATFDNPVGALQMIAEQLPNAAAVIGGGAAGMKAGAMAAPFLGPLAPLAPLAGGVLGMFVGNTALETGGKAIEKGADGFTPAERGDALQEGAVKGAVVTGVDALTLGATRLLFSPVGKAMEQAGVDVLSRAGVNVSDRAAVEAALKTPDLAREVRTAQAAAYKVANAGGKGAARVGGAVGLETLGEGFGEGAGEYAATGTYSPTEAVTEAFAGLGQSAAEVGIGKAWGEAKSRLPGSTVAGGPVAPDPLDQTGLTYEKTVDTYLRGPTEAQTAASVVGAGSIDDAIAAAEAAAGTIPSIAGEKGVTLPRAAAPAGDSLSVIADPALAARQAGAVEAARAQLDGTFPRPVIDPATQASEDLAQNKIVERELMLDDAVRKVEQRAAGAQPTVSPGLVTQRLEAAQAQGDQQAMLRAAQIRDRGQVVASQMTEELSRGDKQRFRIAYENVAKRNGVATPGEAAVLDRMSPTERLYDQVADSPAALKTATQPGLLPTAQQQGTADARADLGARRAGLIPAPPGGTTAPLVVAPAPAAPRATAAERLAAADAATQAERGEQRLGAVSQQAQKQQAQTDAAAAAAATPAPRPAPAPDAVIEALKPIPALRTADQKATIDAARATMTPEQMGILQKAARGPFALDAVERSQLQTMRAAPVAPGTATPPGGMKLSGKRSSEQRLSSLGQSTTARTGKQVTFTVADPKTLAERRRAGGGELSRQVYETIKQTARIFGKKVVVFDSSDDRAADGFIFDDDASTIYINRKAEKPHLVVFGHELMHGLKRNNQAAYDAVAKVVKLKQGVDLDKVAGVQGDMEELVSDLQGNRFAETDFWAEVFREVAVGETAEGRQTVMKLGAAAMRAVNRVMKALGRPAGFEADQMVENLGEVKTAIQQALATYAKDRYADAVAMDQAERAQKTPESEQVEGDVSKSAPADNTTKSAVGDRRLPERAGPPTRAQMAARRARESMGAIASAKRATETPEFKAWWGDDNTMADASGAPRVLYHGTTKANERRITNFKRSAYGAMGPAVYLGDSPEASAGYDQGALMKVYARGKYLTNAQWTKYVNDHGWKGAEAAATADGWAGVYDEQFENAVAVWDPANIKSADKNDGSFDEGEGIKSSEKRKPGQLNDVEAYHFSKGPRKELISAMYGTGLKGSGADEYRNAADPRRRHRIYFYFDKGTGIKPESGVGGAAHKATLNNVYDVNADPLKLAAGTQAKTETAILDAGFDGYLDRLEGSQSGQIIMLGQRAISVQAMPAGTRVVSGKVVPGGDSQPVNPWKTYASGLSKDDADATLARLRAKSSWDRYELEVAPSGNKYEIRMRAKDDVVASGKRAVLNVGLSTAEVDAAERKPPKSFRKSVKVKVSAFMEETGDFAEQEVDADAALKALRADIAEMKAFRACLAGA